MSSTVLFVMRCFYIAKQLAMVLVFAPGQNENPTRAAEGGEIYEGTGETYKAASRCRLHRASGRDPELACCFLSLPLLPST